MKSVTNLKPLCEKLVFYLVVLVVLSLCVFVMSTLQGNGGRMYSHSKVSVICSSGDVQHMLVYRSSKTTYYHEEPDKQAKGKTTADVPLLNWNKR